MGRTIRQLRGWLAAVALVASVAVGLSLREVPSAASTTPEPSLTASAAPATPSVAERVGTDGGMALTDTIVPPRAVRRVPSPTPEPPAPTPEPPAPTPPPPAAAAPPPPPPPAPDPTPDRAGGGLAPRTAPPGWTPPATHPGDIWTSGAFGQTLAAGGISVTATRLPADADPAECESGSPVSDGWRWIGFNVTTSWSGFPIPDYSAAVPDAGEVSCWMGSPSPLVSGVTYRVFIQVRAGSTQSYLRMNYFPYGSSPRYVFEFR